MIKRIYFKITNRLPLSVGTKVWLDHTIANRQWWSQQGAKLRLKIKHTIRKIKGRLR